MTKILVVDDDPAIRQVVGFALEKAGFQVVEVADGREALIAFGREDPSLIVLDINMPEMSGTDVCRSIRASSSVPIVFLSSNDDEIDRVLGLELGGDDYVTKPFSPRELTARVRAVLRRTQHVPASRESKRLSHGDLVLDLDRFEARWRGELVVLTVTEFGIVRTMLRYTGKVYSREELMTGAYDDYTVVSDRTIDSHIRRVRNKFSRAGAADVVETVHGVGYRIGTCVAAEG